MFSLENILMSYYYSSRTFNHALYRTKYMFTNMFKKKQEPIISTKPTQYKVTMQIVMPLTFLDNLIKFIESNKKKLDDLIDTDSNIISIKYEDNLSNTLKVELSNITYTKELSEIQIEYDDIIIQIDKLCFTCVNGKINTINAINKINNPEDELFNIFSKEYYDLTELGIYKWFMTVKFKIVNNSESVMFACTIENKIYQIMKTSIFSSYCKPIYDKLKLVSDEKLHIILANIYCASKIHYLSNFYKNFRNFMNNKYSVQYYTNGYEFPNLPNMTSLSTQFSHIYDKIERKLFINLEEYGLKYSTVQENKPNTNHAIQKTIDIDLITTVEYNKNALYKKFNGFIELVNNMSKKHNTNKKININTINIDDNIIAEKTDNPLYISYQNQKKQLIDEKKSPSDIIQLLGPEPITHIITDKIEKKIKITPVNTKYNAFNNLYLRKQQDTMLFELVERFREDKKIMENLGIPNKLGILLYGEPGCGKTTTIITIASYFGRDIFYVNLKSIKTNQDLKLIFDHINNLHSGGGIIVLEDIDAMTKIVEKRTNDLIETSTTNLVDLSSVDSITFEYLLNLLDGTLTYDDSIVIITTNYLEKLDPALYRPGRIDNLIEMKKCDHYQIERIFNRFMNRNIDKTILKRIPEDTYTPAKVIFSIMNWIKKRENPDHVIMSEFLE